MPASNYVHLTGCNVKRTTDKAVLLDVPQGDTWEEVWVPRSQIAEAGDNLEAGDVDVTVSVTKWIANEKGLEGDD